MNKQPDANQMIRCLEKLILQTNADIQKCVHDFYDMVQLSTMTGTVGFLLTSYVNNEKDNDLAIEDISEHTNNAIDVISFLTKLSGLEESKKKLQATLEKYQTVEASS